MGTNVAPILAHLQNWKFFERKKHCKNDPKMVWRILFKRFIDDGFGITKESKKHVEYWIAELNKVVNQLKSTNTNIDQKWNSWVLSIERQEILKNVCFGIKLSKKSKINTLTFPKKATTENIPSRTLY